MKEEGSIGLYIKGSIEYKVRHDVKKIEGSLGHLRTECKGNNCHKIYLVAGLN